MRLSLLFVCCVLVLSCFYTQNGVKAGQCPAHPSFVVKQGYRLYGHVIYSLYAEKEVLCRLKCNTNERCLTFNYEKESQICEMNDADREKDLQKAQGFVYVDIKRKKKSEVAVTSAAPTKEMPGTVAIPTTSTATTTGKDMDTSTAPTIAGVNTCATTLQTTGQYKQVVAIGIQNITIIPDEYIKAVGTNKNQIRLNDLGGWSMVCHNRKPCNDKWLQINVGKIAKIIGVATQGGYTERSSEFHYMWTEKYRLSYSKNGSHFANYSNTQAFKWNTDWNTTVCNMLTPAITARYVRVYPMKEDDKSGYVALRMELYECKQDEESCSYALGMQSGMILRKQLSASSSYSFHHTYLPAEARLNGEYAWMPSSDDKNPWLQIDLQRNFTITRIATQGYRFWVRFYWVKEYHLQYGNNVTSLQNYTLDSELKTFQGNSDYNTTVDNNIDIAAQVVRIIPIKGNNKIAMRVELYGCDYPNQANCSKALGMEKKLISDSQINASSSYTREEDDPAKYARLDRTRGWMAQYHNQKQWFQIDLLQVKKINGIATQGYGDRNAWLKQYRIQYRNATDNEVLNDYPVGSGPMNLKGNSDGDSIVYNAIDPAIIARIVRIVPTDWNHHIAMRVELYGCPYKGAYDGNQ